MYCHVSHQFFLHPFFLPTVVGNHLPFLRTQIVPQESDPIGPQSVQVLGQRWMVRVKRIFTPSGGVPWLWSSGTRSPPGRPIDAQLVLGRRKLVTGGGFVNQLVSSPVMIAVMIDSTTLILFRHVSHPTVLYLPGVESSRIPGESWVLEVVGLVLPASLGPAANDSVPVSSSGCSLYHCSHSASEYFFFFFFFLGSHLSPQAPSHQYQSPPALRPLHSRPLGRRRLGWLWLPRFCLRFHRPFLSTHQPHSDEVISLWIFQPSKSRNMGCSGSSKSRSSISSAVSARSSFPWDPCCTSSARAAAWPWCSCRRRWVKSLLDMASGQRLGLITPRVSHYRVPSQRTPPRGRCKCTFFTPTWARRTWANSHSWRNLNDRENFKNDLMGVQWCPVHFSQPQYPFIDD